MLVYQRVVKKSCDRFVGDRCGDRSGCVFSCQSPRPGRGVLGPKTKSQPWKVKSSIQKATAKAEAASLVVGTDRCWFSMTDNYWPWGKCCFVIFKGNARICQDLVLPNPTLSNKANSVGFLLLLKLLHGPVGGHPFTCLKLLLNSLRRGWREKPLKLSNPAWA